MANKKQQIQTEETENKTENVIPTEEELKNSESSEEKLELMKKLLANQKVAEPKKQKLVYKAMGNITVVRN